MASGKSGIVQLRNNYFRSVDYFLLIPVVVLTIIGIFVLDRVLSEGYDGYPQVLYRQAIAGFLGMSMALFICLIHTHFLKIIGWITYAVSTMLLILVLIDGFSMMEIWGADAWRNLPVLGTFQPSELSKIGLVVVTSYLLEAIKDKEIPYFRGIAALIAVYALPVALIMKQPDFGTTMVILFSLACMIFVWGIKYRYLFLSISGAVVVLLPLMWQFFLEPYQKTRILSFIFAGSDPHGEYNLIQSKTAIASGGLIGNHTGTVVTVPVKQSDFIYSAVSEHMGFIGTTAVVFLAFFFLARCLYVGSKTRQKSYSYIVVGLSGSFAFHFIENIGMGVGLLPITGIPLPFISLGGTSLMVSYISFGIILNIAMERKSPRL